MEKGYKGCNNGEPITREFFDEHISGGHNILLGKHTEINVKNAVKECCSC